MRKRSLAAVAALSMAGVGLVAAPAQADVVPLLHCSYTTVTKHNGQHLMTIQGVITEWGYAGPPSYWVPIDETNMPVTMYWYNDSSGTRVFGQLHQRRLQGLTLSINLDRVGIHPDSGDVVYSVDVWTQPQHAQEDGCRPA